MSYERGLRSGYCTVGGSVSPRPNQARRIADCCTQAKKIIGNRDPVSRSPNGMISCTAVVFLEQILRYLTLLTLDVMSIAS